MKIKLLALALFMLANIAVWAQTTPAPADTTKVPTFWDTAKGEIKFGLSDYRGNTEKTDLIVEAKFSKAWEKNTLSVKVGGVYSESQAVKIQENYYGSLLDEQSFSKAVGAYAKYSFLRDEFAGYKWVNKLGAGALFTAVDKASFSLKGRLGYEYRTEEYVNAEQASTASNTGKAGLRIEGKLMKNVALSAESNYQLDFANTDNYFADGFIKFVFDVNTAIDIEMGYSLDYKNIPPEGKERLDKVFATTLKIKF